MDPEAEGLFTAAAAFNGLSDHKREIACQGVGYVNIIFMILIIDFRLTVGDRIPIYVFFYDTVRDRISMLILCRKIFRLICHVILYVYGPDAVPGRVQHRNSDTSQGAQVFMTAVSFPVHLAADIDIVLSGPGILYGIYNGIRITVIRNGHFGSVPVNIHFLDSIYIFMSGHLIDSAQIVSIPVFINCNIRPFSLIIFYHCFFSDQFIVTENPEQQFFRLYGIFIAVVIPFLMDSKFQICTLPVIVHPEHDKRQLKTIPVFKIYVRLFVHLHISLNARNSKFILRILFI